METKTAVTLANIAGKLDAASAFADDKLAVILLEAAENIFAAIREDLPYSLKGEQI